jgi:hypothetical protein
MDAGGVYEGSLGQSMQTRNVPVVATTSMRTVCSTVLPGVIVICIPGKNSIGAVRR